MNRSYRLIFGLMLLWACHPPVAEQPYTGIWRMELNLKPEAKLPFNFELNEHEGSYQMLIHNGEERIAVEEFSLKGDSVFIQMPVFDSEFRLKLHSPTRLSGYWHNLSKGEDYRIAALAEHGKNKRFDLSSQGSTADLGGKWEVHFSPEEAAKTLPMLNHVMSYPTSIFLDRAANVRNIHTGFTGPGTGDLYTRFVEQYTAFIEQLLEEE